MDTSNEKEPKVIVATAKIGKEKQLSKTLQNNQVIQELLPLFFFVLGIGLWIKYCMAMEDPIFLQKALNCSFIIIAVLFFKKSAEFNPPQ